MYKNSFLFLLLCFVVTTGCQGLTEDLDELEYDPDAFVLEDASGPVDAEEDADTSDRPDPPVIESIHASPQTVEPEALSILTAEVASDVEEELSYQWDSSAEDWNIFDSTEPEARAEAPDEFGVSTNIQLRVTDPYGGDDVGAIVVATPEIDGPEIVTSYADPESTLPGQSQVVTVEASHPADHQLDYDWLLPTGWEPVDGEELIGDTVELRAPDEHGVSGSVTFMITDQEDRAIDGSQSVSTKPNPGPEIESIDSDDTVVDPGGSVELTAIADHEYGYDLDYAWSVETEDDWQFADDDGEQVELHAPDTENSSAEVTVTVADEYGSTIDDTLSLVTDAEDNQPPVIEQMHVGEDVIDPGESTAIHAEAVHPDGLALNYDWNLESDDDWQLAGDGDEVDLTSPNEPDSSVEVSIVVSDAHGESDQASVTVLTSPEDDKPPVIQNLVIDDNPVAVDDSTQAHVDAFDPNDDDLEYVWEVTDTNDGWSIEDSDAPSTILDAAGEPGLYAQITVTVTDDTGKSTSESIAVETESNRGPEIISTTDFSTPLDVEKSVPVQVEAEHSQVADASLSYDWTISNEADGWSITNDDAPSTEVTTAEVPDSTATITAVVSDDFDGSEQAEIHVQTTETKGPDILEISVDNPLELPVDTEQLAVSVEFEHPQGFRAESFHWSLSDPDGDGWDIDEVDSSSTSFDTPHVPDSEATIDVTVIDEHGGEDSFSLQLRTEDSHGPNIQGIDVIDADEPLPLYRPIQLEVDTDHPQGFTIGTYEWSIVDAPDGWDIETVNSDQTDVTVSAPGSEAIISVTVADEYKTEKNFQTTFVAEPFCGGEGTADAPWQICSAETLHHVGASTDYLGDSFELTDDIDLSSIANFNPIGDDEAPFTGTFDSRGHKITNLTIDRDDTGVGLFGVVDIGDDMTLSDLHLEDVAVSGDEDVGALIGELRSGSVTDSSTTGTVSGSGELGGLIGTNGGTINRSRSSVNVEAHRATTDISTGAGGLVGYNSGSITNCYATGDIINVEGTNYTGGLVGRNGYSAVVEDSYASGVVSGHSAGGLIGSQPDRPRGGVLSSYWNIETSNFDDSEGGDPLTTRQFGDRSHFSDWSIYPETSSDFDWVMHEADNGEIRPELAWEHPCDTDGDCNSNACTAGSCVACDPLASPFGGGTGDDNTPWRVCSANQINEIGDGTDHLDDAFVLYEDIDLDELGGDFNMVGDNNTPFEGRFDGAGYTIDNLLIEKPDTEMIGLFGQTDEAIVEHVIVRDPDVTGYRQVGGLVGRMNGGEISESSVQSGVIQSTSDVNFFDPVPDAMGGLVGLVNGGTIRRSHASADAEAVGLAAGFVGINAGTINDSYSTGEVSASHTAGFAYGFAANNDGDIEHSYWDSDTSGSSDSHGGSLLTTEEFRFHHNFADWNIYPADNPNWVIREDEDGKLRPRLTAFQGCGHDLDCPRGGHCDTDAGICVECDASATPFGGGHGTENSPYRICSAEHLRELSSNDDHLDDHFIVTDPIDLDEELPLEPIGIGSDDGFQGTFDGHRITNAEISVGDGSSSLAESGFFTSIESTGKVDNLILEDAKTVGSDNASRFGGIAGRNDGTIQRSLVSGQFEGRDIVGGLVGLNYGSITQCRFDGELSGRYEVGGLVGANRDSIENSSSESTVEGNSQVGGLAGTSEGSIVNSEADADVSADTEVGGLVGTNLDSITDSETAGTVSGESEVGGLVGDHESGVITSSSSASEFEEAGSGDSVGGLVGVNSADIISSEATGNVNGDLYEFVGGLVGDHRDGEITRCHASGDVNGLEAVGGLVGRSGSDISESYATGDLADGTDVGGLVGWVVSGTITDSYALGHVSGPGNYWAGLVGRNEAEIRRSYSAGEVAGGSGITGGLLALNGGLVSNSYWDIDTSNQGSSDGGAPLANEQFGEEETFPGWDFEETWTIGTAEDGDQRPVLQWQ